MRHASEITTEIIRVLVSDSTRMGCQLLADALRRSDHGFVVSACGANSREILSALVEKKPQVALISAHLEDGPRAGFPVLRQAQTCSPKTRSILLVEASEPETVINAFYAGAKGIFCRRASFEALCKCILAVNKGQIWANSTELQFVLEVLARSAPVRPLNGNATAQLSRREQDVVNLVAQGLTNREISGKLNLSAHTVKNYLFRIFERLGISSRVELVLYALDQREPQPPPAAKGFARVTAHNSRSGHSQAPPSA